MSRPIHYMVSIVPSWLTGMDCASNFRKSTKDGTCCRGIAQTWAEFRASNTGAAAIAFSLALPVLVALGASAVEYSTLSSKKTSLQAALDAATIAAASELSLSNANERTVESILKRVLMTHLVQVSGEPSLEFQIDRDSMRVSTEATLDVDMTFASLFGFDAITIGAQAAAQAMGQPNICVLGLDERASGTISLDSQSRLTANGCAVFSNSASSTGIQGTGRSLLTSATTCSAGGFNGGSQNFEPMPFVDCPTFDDPLRDRQPPTFSGCDYNNMRITGNQRATLSPGVYCGGLEVAGNSEITLAPGIYVMSDGDFRVVSNAVVIGRGVGIYLSGPTSRLYYGPRVRVDLEAPETGEMAGLLLFSDRAQSGSIVNEIKSNFVRNMVGTVYLPAAEFHVTASNPVADQSAYTAIVVNRLELARGPNLVLNSNYDQTNVPVPDGIRGAGSPVRLVE